MSASKTITSSQPAASGPPTRPSNQANSTHSAIKAPTSPGGGMAVNDGMIAASSLVSVSYPMDTRSSYVGKMSFMAARC
jgi:hypothetical protein